MQLVCEIGDFRRFESPTALMAYLGLIPSQRSSGNTIRTGAITKGSPNNKIPILLRLCRSGCNRRARSVRRYSVQRWRVCGFRRRLGGRRWVSCSPVAEFPGVGPDRLGT